MSLHGGLWIYIIGFLGGWEVTWGGTGRSSGMENRNQDLLCTGKKIYFQETENLFFFLEAE